MAENGLVSIAAWIFNISITSFLIAIPVFLIALFSFFLQKKIAKKYSLKWLQSSMAATYLTMLILIFFLYLFPFAISSIEIGGILSPQDFPPALLDQIAFIAYSLVKILLSSAVVTFLLMPLEFFALFFFEKLEKFKLPDLAKKFLTVYACTIAVLVLLFFNPWVLQGLLFMIYWA